MRSICFQIKGQGKYPIDELYQEENRKLHLPMALPICCLLVTCTFVAFALRYPSTLTLTLLMFLFYGNALVSNKIRGRFATAFLSAQQLYQYAQAILAIQASACATSLKQAYEIPSLAASFTQLHRSMFPDIYQGDGFILAFAKNVLFCEIFSFRRLYRALQAHEASIRKAVAVIGELEALMAAEMFVAHQPTVCDAQFVQEVMIEATGMVHPLIKKPIANDVCLCQNVLISGSNASGKSTYLKMIAINAIFAQCFGSAFANTYQARMFHVATSMSIQDSLAKKESYFMAEVRSMKRMLDETTLGVPLLCMIDEILRGTNTGERIAAASSILMQFVRPDIIALAATHDLELTSILSNHYQNIHFSEEMLDGIMHFTYQLKIGPSNSHNALPLLASLGFEQTLLQDAQRLRTAYEQTGTWTWEGDRI